MNSAKRKILVLNKDNFSFYKAEKEILYLFFTVTNVFEIQIQFYANKSQPFEILPSISASATSTASKSSTPSFPIILLRRILIIDWKK